MQVARESPRVGAWRREANDLLRGLTGGFLVGIPLLYTMETWWIGETISMLHALAFLVLAYAVNLAGIVFSGFRRRRGGSRPFADALEATSLAAVVAAATLTLLHQLAPGQPLGMMVGRIAVDTLPVSLGASIANHILASREGRAGPDAVDGDAGGGQGAWRALVLDLGAAGAGALFVSLNIAPTEEVPMLATEMPTLYLPVLVVCSLLVSYAIVFEAGFGDQRSRRETTGPFQRPLPETVIAYAVSLAICVVVLWLFGQIDATTDRAVAFAQVVVLGLPATIGGAAGRLAM